MVVGLTFLKFLKSYGNQNTECPNCLLSSNNVKKRNVIIKNDFFFEIFCENHPTTRHINYKAVDFAPINKSIKKNKLPSTNLEQIPRRIIESPLKS